VSDTARGAIIFIAILLTIGTWAPLRNKPERTPSGVIVTETYFGVFRYLTLRTELREPNYEMQMIPNYPKLAVTGIATAVLWCGVLVATRKRKDQLTVR
jgi:hypothetical protein